MEAGLNIKITSMSIFYNGQVILLTTMINTKVDPSPIRAVPKLYLRYNWVRGILFLSGRAFGG